MTEPDDLPDAVAEALEAGVNERTSMAWNRTALAWGAVGAIVVRYHASDGLWAWPTVPGYVLMALGAVVFVAGSIRYRRRDRIMRTEGRFPEPVGHLSLVTGATVLAVAAITVIEIAQLRG